MRGRVVYVPGVFDLLHYGHINIIKTAKKYGDVIIVGLLGDEAAAGFKNPTVLPYRHREIVMKALRDVDAVMPQETLDYVPNLRKLKPDIVIHGGQVQSCDREEVIEALKEWGGELIEVPYTEGISSTRL